MGLSSPPPFPHTHTVAAVAAAAIAEAETVAVHIAVVAVLARSGAADRHRPTEPSIPNPTPFKEDGDGRDQHCRRNPPSLLSCSCSNQRHYFGLRIAASSHYQTARRTRTCRSSLSCVGGGKNKYVRVSKGFDFCIFS